MLNKAIIPLQNTFSCYMKSVIRPRCGNDVERERCGKSLEKGLTLAQQSWTNNLDLL